MTPEQRKHFKYVRDEMHGEAQPAVALEHEWLRGECVKCGASIERQEPVAFLTNHRQRINVQIKPEAFVWMPTTTDWEVPLYFAPPKRKPLTDEQIGLLSTSEPFTGFHPMFLRDCVRAIETAHGIKE